MGATPTGRHTNLVQAFHPGLSCLRGPQRILEFAPISPVERLLGWPPPVSPTAQGGLRPDPLQHPSPQGDGPGTEQALLLICQTNKWPEYWSFSFSINPSNEHPGLIAFRMGWLDLLAVQGILKSLLQYHRSKASILQCSAFFIVQLSHLYMTTGKTICVTP